MYYSELGVIRLNKLQRLFDLVGKIGQLSKLHHSGERCLYLLNICQFFRLWFELDPETQLVSWSFFPLSPDWGCLIFGE